jgi:hypothetical protein
MKLFILKLLWENPTARLSVIDTIRASFRFDMSRKLLLHDPTAEDVTPPSQQKKPTW